MEEVTGNGSDPAGGIGGTRAPPMDTMPAGRNPIISNLTPDKPNLKT